MPREASLGKCKCRHTLKRCMIGGDPHCMVVGCKCKFCLAIINSDNHKALELVRAVKV